jgi:hypothetical protein
MAKVLTARYGRYDLKAGPMGGTFTARAFLRGARPGHGTTAEATGPSAEAALTALETLLRDREAAERQSRRLASNGVLVPGPDAYRLALAVVRVHPNQWAMLNAHAAAGPNGLSATQLARAGSYDDFSTANLHYGKLGRLVADDLAMALPVRANETEVATAALATYDLFPDGIQRWVIHPELATAVL